LLAQFKNFQVNQLQLDDLLSLSVFGKNLKAEYDRYGVEVPDWVDTNLRILNNTIQAKIADATQLRIKKIQSQLEALQTPTERREALTKELERLTKAAGAQ
jgi:hypothetical protein